MTINLYCRIIIKYLIYYYNRNKINKLNKYKKNK